LEGWRQQMLFAYATAAAVILLAIVHPAPVQALWPRLVGGGVGLLLLAIATVLCVLRPVILTPAPSGSLKIGTTTVSLGIGEADALTFSVWYPAGLGPGAGRAGYLTENRVGVRFQQLGCTQAIRDAPIATDLGRLPILIFMPGWGGVPSQNTVLLQDLASNGYFVAAPDAWDPAAYPGDSQAAADLQTTLDFRTTDSSSLARQAGLRNAHRQAGLAIQALNQLTMLNASQTDRRFNGRLDMDHVGVLGFSFGGSVAVQAALEDKRFRAVANLDGWVFTDAYLRGFPQPYLLVSMPPQTEVDLHSPDPQIRGEAAMTLEDEARLRTFFEKHGGTRAIAPSIGHDNFRDAALLFPLRRNRSVGAMEAHRARKLVSDLLITFFDGYLHDRPVPRLAQIATAYPEVHLFTW
jgi:predicted dienelactone hydrolase